MRQKVMYDFFVHWLVRPYFAASVFETNFTKFPSLMGDDAVDGVFTFAPKLKFSYSFSFALFYFRSVDNNSNSKQLKEKERKKPTSK